MPTRDEIEAIALLLFCVAVCSGVMVVLLSLLGYW